MKSLYLTLRARLTVWGLLPAGRVARGAWFALGMAAVLFLLQKFLGIFKSSWGESLGGWVGFLSFVSILLFTVLAFRWLKAKILWRLRNRLIVTYVFIGVVPILLLVSMAFATLYLFAGQFANFIVTSEIHLQLHSVEAVNAAIAHELAARLERGESPNVELLERLRKSETIWKDRQVCAWLGTKVLPVCGDSNKQLAFPFPSFIHGPFIEIARDHEELYLRAATVVPLRSEQLMVVSSEALDQELVQEIGNDLGEITLYTTGLRLPPQATDTQGQTGNRGKTSSNEDFAYRQDRQGITLEAGGEPLYATFTGGTIPAPANTFDHEITFATPLPVVEWESGNRRSKSAVVRVQTRPSVLYARLFAALGDFTKGIETILFAIAIVLAIKEPRGC